MKELIAKLEKASEGSRELDVEIDRYRPPHDPRNRQWSIPRCSSSADAAIEFARDTMCASGHAMFEIHARIVHNGRGPTAFMEITVPSSEHKGWAHGRHAEARGLCIAALKARMAEEG